MHRNGAEWALYAFTEAEISTLLGLVCSFGKPLYKFLVKRYITRNPRILYQAAGLITRLVLRETISYTTINQEIIYYLCLAASQGEVSELSSYLLQSIQKSRAVYKLANSASRHLAQFLKSLFFSGMVLLYFSSNITKHLPQRSLFLGLHPSA